MIPFTELLRMQLKLDLNSDVGDGFAASAPALEHNSVNTEAVLDAFDAQACALRTHLQLYLDRRAERRKNWKG